MRRNDDNLKGTGRKREVSRDGGRELGSREGAEREEGKEGAGRERAGREWGTGPQEREERNR